MALKYYSTRDKTLKHDFGQAVVQGLAPDGGLYLPEAIPRFSMDFWNSLRSKTPGEIGFELIRPYTKGVVPDEKLHTITSESFDFAIPIVPLGGSASILELFHGPTLAFKDFGARFLSRVLSHLASKENREIHILAATSGDTGGAVAQGFYQVPGTRVWVLYPKGKVSPIQERQFTTLGGNISALEVDGNFDDCQKLVKQAFSDKDLASKIWITSANSINIARLLPQMVYYAWAWTQLAEVEGPPVFAVPCGNLGNLTAGVLAWRMGLPVKHFIAATNRNDVFPEYLLKGNFTPRASISTISNAMDVGNPSNFERLVALFPEGHQSIQSMISGYRFDDFQTIQAMKVIHHGTGYVSDQHTAVAFAGLQSWQQAHPESKAMVLGTAHPAKFSEVVEKALGASIELPGALKEMASKDKKNISIENDFGSLKQLLLG